MRVKAALLVGCVLTLVACGSKETPASEATGVTSSGGGTTTSVARAPGTTEPPTTETTEAPPEDTAPETTAEVSTSTSTTVKRTTTTRATTSTTSRTSTSLTPGQTVTKAQFKQQLDDVGLGSAVDTQCLVDQLEAHGFVFRKYGDLTADDQKLVTDATIACVTGKKF